MNTKTHDLPYDSTYFRMSDVAPWITDEVINIYNGKGSRRSWGAPSVISTVVVDDADLVAVHVGFSHKHRGGQGWHYWLGGTKRTWAQLPDAQREKVLANEHKAPRWAKSPGALRAERKPSPEPQIAYKLVKVNGDKLLSLYDSKTEYTIGKRLVQAARENHQGGYYSYSTEKAVRVALAAGTIVPRECLTEVEKFALLRCEIAGKIITYGNKQASTYLTPIEIVETIDVAATN